MANLNNANNRKRDKPGRFGTDIGYTSRTLIDFTANTTVYSTMGTPFTNPAFLERLSFSIQAAGLDADGTLLIRVQKIRGGSGGTVTNLTGQVSVEAAIVTVQPSSFTIDFLTTLTPYDFSFIAGDTIRVEQVNNSAAIDTQPSQLTVVAEWAAGQ